MESRTEYVLRAIRLAISFDGRMVLREASLSLKLGEHAVLLGENGVGKTTFLKLLALVLPVSQGSLELFGVRVKAGVPTSQLAELRRRIAVVWQQTLLEADATCWENVYTTALYSGVPRADRKRRTEEALNAVGLLRRALDKAGTLNGGARKKLALAQAIVHLGKNGLLLLDEPAANLSRGEAEQVLEFLKRLRCTILVITHDLNWAAKFSSQQYRLADGRITAERPQKIEPATAAAIVAAPRLAPEEAADFVFTVETGVCIWSKAEERLP